MLFVGSERRTAADSCFVELRFDNDGEDADSMWGKQSKIIVRRELHRDGRQEYSVNGDSVRRRDVVDLFRGTGVSPRAYGVIEQGMITRVADSSPEELRGFLEEAAGVSHYKERKRECEQRLQSGRENLEQVAVILGGMQKRAGGLQRQARKARRYRDLTEKINALDALLIAGKRSAAEAKLATLRKTLAELEEKTNAARSKLDGLKTAGDENRERHNTAQNEADAAQQTLAEARAGVAAAERDLQNAESGRQAAQQRLGDSEKELSALTAQTTALADEEKLLEQREAAAQKTLDDGGAAAKQQAEQQQTTLDTRRQKQTALEEAREKLAEITRTLESRKVRRQMLAERLTSLRGRINETEKNMAASAADDIGEEEEPKDDEAQVADCRALLADKQRQNAALAEKAESIQTVVRTAETALAALTAEINTLQTMLKEDGWAEREMPRLAETLQVDAGDWARALDAALGAYAAAAVVEDIDAFVDDAGAPPPAAALVEIGRGADKPAEEEEHPPHPSAGLPSLLSALTLSEKNKKNFAVWLRGWYAAETEAQAAAARRNLRVGEYIVTRSGGVYGAASLLSPGADARGGYNWEQRMRDLSAAKQEKENDLSTAQSERQAALAAVQAAAAQADDAAAALEAARQRLADRRIEWNRRREQRLALQARRREFAELLEVMRGEHDELSETEKTLAEQFAATNAECETAQGAFAAAQTALAAAEEALQESARRVAEDEEKRREVEMQLAEMKQQRRDIALRLRDVDARRRGLEERVAAHRRELSAADKSALREARDAKQKHLDEVATALSACQENLRAADAQNIALEKERETARGELEKSQQQAGEERLNEREMTLTAAHCAEALEELALTEAQLAELQTAHENETEEQWKADMESMRAKREQLGAINFTAADELEECERTIAEQEAQKNDVETAINELYNAIQRIDRETQTKMRMIFDGVNQHFAPLFRRLFGGGEARLDMTGTGILDAVFELKVRPPGKRLIPIKMLSGGEKAAAALAFVFSILQLNPPPFCVLDEVDAPLDDRRAERFSEILKDVALTVQCLVVTHNKGTISTMPRLIGVTQEEPGVSKVVSVTMDENK